MLKAISKTLLLMSLFAAFLYAAQTKLNLSNQVTGLLAIANGGTNASSVSSGVSFSGPVTGSDAAPSFKAPSANLGILNVLNGGRNYKVCTATGTTVTCMGDNADTAGTDTPATSTLPSYTSATSDTTGAGCGTDLDSLGDGAYAGREATFVTYARLDSITGVRSRFGFVFGPKLFCTSDTSNTSAVAMFEFSTSVPETTYWGVTADGVGTDYVKCDTTVTADTAFHWFKIVFDNAGGEVDFYVDDMATPKCSVNSNFDATISYHYVFHAYCNSCGGVAKNIDIANWYISYVPF